MPGPLQNKEDAVRRNSESRQQEQVEQSSVPGVTLPKGGGAIRGIDQKFRVNAANGTASQRISFPLSPSRNLTPTVEILYNSGAGNSPFGFGWQLSLPTISRKTEKGLPRYLDTKESDVFILSDAEDLVPVLEEQSGQWKRKSKFYPALEPKYRIDFYRPRVEGLFARIERWTQIETGEVHWRSISSNNITTLYGKTEESRIADPENPGHVFRWLICEIHDSQGNAVIYEYKTENSESINTSQAHEIDRSEQSRSANRYIKRIKYGNRISHLIQPNLSQVDWMFEVIFDYGEHDNENPTPDDTGAWIARNDPFSIYRSTFEVRTYRLCQRILLFHHFVEEENIGQNYLVRSLEFLYRNSRENPEDGQKGHPTASFLASLTQSSYKKQNNGYLKKSLPALEFRYSEAKIDENIQEIEGVSLDNIPSGFDDTKYRWIDLDGEGISGILTAQANAWYYKENFGNGDFGPLQFVTKTPSIASTSRSPKQFLDLGGNGQLDLVSFAESSFGFYERTSEKNWENFKAFQYLPNLVWDDPNLRFIDLTGDGHADILITEQDAFTWSPSLQEEGFGTLQKIHQTLEQEKGPKLIFADETQSIFLADMSGDGLTDLVRIRTGEVCYWPNLGYGRFAAKITMDHSPHFDSTHLFDQRRIRLADIDGSGTSDIIYLGYNRVSLYYNQSGNSWSQAQVIDHFPNVDNLSSITVVDLLGRGTACLVWSSTLQRDRHKPLRYIDLMGGQKPHLLVSIDNNMGAETRIEYAASTKFYVEDKKKGNFWVTRLPFPIHVVERIETYDHINQNRFVNRYAYHHGYFDGIEREFRGFGMVEQWDTEEFTVLDDPNALSSDRLTPVSHLPPVKTKTWFHTGAYLKNKKLSKQFQTEYYREPGNSESSFKALVGTILPEGLLPEEEREAYRVLKGSILRQEVYALDGSAQEEIPYIVSEANFSIRRLQPKKKNQNAVFFASPQEEISYHYERNSQDPRITHEITLEVNEFAQKVKTVSIAYGRQQLDPSLETQDQEIQQKTYLVSLENSFTNSIDEIDTYRIPLPSEIRSFELTGVASENRFDFMTIKNAVPAAIEIPYESPPDGSLQKRLIEHSRILYRRNDLTDALPLGEVESLALPYQSYQLALTPELLTQAFEDRVSDALLLDDGKYIHLDGDSNWWAPSEQVFYSPNESDLPSQEKVFAEENFYLPHRIKTSFGSMSFLRYDAYHLLLLESADALQNKFTAGERDENGLVTPRNNYRVLSAELVTDPNGNRSQVVFDTFGLLVGTALMGKPGQALGDSLNGFLSDLDENMIQAHIQNPLVNPQEILGQASTRLVYDMHRYQRSRHLAKPEPNVVYTVAREMHASDINNTEQNKIQHSFVYLDGFGREIQQKIQAEPGEVDGTHIDQRWVGTGWTIYNNKGNPIRKYEPFFSHTNNFEFSPVSGVSSTLFYDPIERVIAILNPNHTYEKILFTPWQEQTWDVNDTLLEANPLDDKDIGGFFTHLPTEQYLPTWYTKRVDGSLGTLEQSAAAKSEEHSNTPSIVYFDSLGRPFLTMANNGSKGTYTTRVKLDVEGNTKLVSDTKERIVMRYHYDMIGNVLRQDSMESGTRWICSNIAGNPIYSWDSKNHRVRSTYDILQRPIEIFLQKDTEDELLIERTIYGEIQGDLENHRGQIYQKFDSAGVLTFESYDYKGNLLHSTRQFAQEYTTKIDWSVNIALESKVFHTSTTYDALNRAIFIVTPDNSAIRPSYREASLLETLEVKIRGAADATSFIENIDYNARGQRTLIQYGNGVSTSYEYDEQTFRLAHLKTHRGQEILQDLFYTYDPIGNISNIRDNAQQTIYFNNSVVEAHSDYTYDAIYQLIKSTGREHIGQILAPQTSWHDQFRSKRAHPNDGQAMRRYREQYEYDEVGNFLQLIHIANNGNWQRTYTYDESSLLEPLRKNNRLSRTEVGNTLSPYLYDEHGNMIQMPHLSSLEWDQNDQLQKVDLAGGGTAYYIYDSTGQRVRKVIERQNGTRQQERFYLDGFELYREYNGNQNTISLERETLHVMDVEQRIALVETKTIDITTTSQDSLIRYQLGNHLGSSSLELDDQAQLISYEEFYPYGSTSYQAVRNQVEAFKRYRYVSMERDEESGLEYHGARYYTPWLAKWTSADPIGLNDGVNVYRYGNNNPVNFSDTNGNETDEKKASRLFAEFLDEQGVAYGKEVYFRVKVGDKWVTGRTDFLVKTGPNEWKPVEMKGKQSSTWTKAQKKYLPALQDGAEFEITGKFQRGYKGSGGGKVFNIKSVVQGKFDFRRLFKGTYINRTKGFKETITTDNDGNVVKREKKKLAAVAGGGGAAKGGKVASTAGKAFGVLGKATKITTVIEAGVTVVKVGDHLLDGEFKKAGKEVADFAYDQTVGTVKDIYDLGSGAVSSIGNFISGSGSSSKPKPPQKNRILESLKAWAALGALLEEIRHLPPDAPQETSETQSTPNQGGGNQSFPNRVQPGLPCTDPLGIILPVAIQRCFGR